MRGTLTELHSPVSLFAALPTMFHDSDFTRRFVSAFDTLLAPVFAALDNFSAYLDPQTTPDDFLGWLAGWLDLELDADWSEARRRAAVGQVVEVYRSRGTRLGVVAQLAVQLDADVEIDDGGGVSWSRVPGSALPATGSHEVGVRIRVADVTTLDRRRVEGLVRAAVPAHLVTSVEIIADPSAPTGGSPRRQDSVHQPSERHVSEEVSPDDALPAGQDDGKASAS